MLAPGDAEIMRQCRNNPSLTTEHLSILLGRSPQVCRRRVAELCRLGYLRSEVWREYEHRCVYPTRSGWKWIHELKFTDDLILMGRERSMSRFEHELMITDFYVANRSVIVDWERLPLYLHDNSFGIWPDCAFTVGRQFFFLENEHSKRKGKKSGGTPLEAMLEEYERYHVSGQFAKRWDESNFRVVVMMATREKAINLINRLTDREVNLGRVLVTWNNREFKIASKPDQTFNILGNPLELEVAQIAS